MSPPRPAALPCELCDGREPLPATATYVDAFGFAYHLCGAHHETLSRGLSMLLRRRLLGQLSGTSVRRYPKPRLGRQSRTPIRTGSIRSTEPHEDD